jgi:hypothetical protein
MRSAAAKVWFSTFTARRSVQRVGASTTMSDIEESQPFEALIEHVEEERLRYEDPEFGHYAFVEQARFQGTCYELHHS